MGVGAGLYMYHVVVKKFTFAILSPDEFVFIFFVVFPIFRMCKDRDFKFGPYHSNFGRMNDKQLRQGAWVSVA